MKTRRSCFLPNTALQEEGSSLGLKGHPWRLLFLSVTNHISLALMSPWFSPGKSLPQPPTSPIILSPISGLKRIHALTTQAAYELHVDLEDFDNGTAYAHYGSFGVGLFSVDPEEDGYPLTVADYSGTAGRGPGCSGGGEGLGPPPHLDGQRKSFQARGQHQGCSSAPPRAQLVLIPAP